MMSRLQAPTPRDAVKVTVQLRTPLAVQAASLQYEIAHSGMAPAALSMQVDGDTLGVHCIRWPSSFDTFV
jgi:hypothetical protein